MPRAGFILTRDDVERWLAARDEDAHNELGRELIAREQLRALAESADVAV
jgi:putative SOS response-associated peptidase YedK